MAKKEQRKLTDLEVKSAAPREEPYKLPVGDGLYVLIKPDGTKYLRYNYRFGGKQKTLALGVYGPEKNQKSLKDARIELGEAKASLAKGIDPMAERQKARKATIEADTFGAIAKEWWNQQKGTWIADHAARVWKRLEDNCKPVWQESIVSIEPQDVLAIIRQIEARDALDVAGRVLQDIRRVCRYAIQTGKARHNPATELSGATKTRKTDHRASLPREALPDFLVALSQYQERGRLLTQLAIRLLVLTFVRPGELRGARWEEFDFNENLWRIPGKRMKMGTDHIVPLSRQALEAIEQVRPITGQYELLFPSERDRLVPMSDNTMRRAIFKLGYDGNTVGKPKAVPHGFRATASSILNEQGFNPDAIERQLAHMERNGVRAAYIHHARYLDERTHMMQWWADYLDKLETGSNVIQVNFKQAQ